MIGGIFEVFLIFIFIKKGHAFSEIIEANYGDDTIRCTDRSLESGCLIMCQVYRDCFSTDIYCYPDAPCRIECVPRSSGDTDVCRYMNAHGNNASIMDVYVNSLADYTATLSNIYASGNGPTNIHATGYGSFLLEKVNIYGHDGQPLSITTSGISGSSVMGESRIHCPSLDDNGTSLCDFNCLNGSDCSNRVSIYTDNGIPDELQINCDQSSDCGALRVYCDVGLCEMEWNETSAEWACTGWDGMCLYPTNETYAYMYIYFIIHFTLTKFECIYAYIADGDLRIQRSLSRMVRIQSDVQINRSHLAVISSAWVIIIVDPRIFIAIQTSLVWSSVSRGHLMILGCAAL